MCERCLITLTCINVKHCIRPWMHVILAKTDLVCKTVLQVNQRVFTRDKRLIYILVNVVYVCRHPLGE